MRPSVVDQQEHAQIVYGRTIIKVKYASWEESNYFSWLLN